MKWVRAMRNHDDLSFIALAGLTSINSTFVFLFRTFRLYFWIAWSVFRMKTHGSVCVFFGWWRPVERTSSLRFNSQSITFGERENYIFWFIKFWYVYGFVEHRNNLWICGQLWISGFWISIELIRRERIHIVQWIWKNGILCGKCSNNGWVTFLLNSHNIKSN